MRILSGVVVAMGLLGCGGAELDDTEPMATQGQEIVGGVEARPGSRPWIVSLQNGTSHFCGGSILSPTIILTAAHCVADGAPDRIVAGAHDHYRPSASQTAHRPVAVRMHPQYDADTTTNDIAIIKVTPPIQFAATRAPIPLVTPQDEAAGAIAPEVVAVVSGWGLTREGGYDTSSILMEVAVPLISHAQLTRSYAPQGIQILPTMLGAGYVAGGKDACQGDSGGPLTIRTTVRAQSPQAKLAGVVSFGVGCARPGLPGVYTRVSRYSTWIAQTIKALN